MIALIRSIYLIIVAAAFPLAFLHYDYFHPEDFIQLGSSAKGAIVFGSFFLIMFHLLFTARYFPFDVKSGLILLTGIVTTIFTSSLLNNASPFLGAFSMVYAISLTYFLYFLIMCILFFNPSKREALFYYSEKPYILLLVFLMAVCLTVVGILSSEYYRALMIEDNLFLIIIALTSLAYEMYSGVYALMKNNMFQFDQGKEKEIRDEQLKKSGWLAVILMFSSAAGIALIVYLI